MKSKYNSSLFNEIGNIELFRVSEETKKKVQEETNLIEQKMAEHNLNSRKRFKKEEIDKIRKHEHFRNQMIDRWKKKTENSPFQVDQFETYSIRREKESEKSRLQLKYLKRSQYIDSMLGRDTKDLVTPQLSNVLTGQEKLALGLRKAHLDEKVIKKESSVLDKMLDEELDHMIQKFPNLNPEFSTVDEYKVSRASTSLGSNSSQTLTDKPLSRDRSKIRSRVDKSKGSFSTTSSFSRDYIPPNRSMNEISDDMSAQLSVSNLDLS